MPKHIIKDPLLFKKVSYETFYKAMKELTGANDDFIEDCYNRLKLPKRATIGSAGYDFFSPFSFDLEPGQTITIPTGIKIQMPKTVFALGVPRSSYGFKYKMSLDNTVMIGDSDFYNNPKNEGHYMAKVTNHGDKTMEVNIGDAYMQCIFLPYLITDDDDTVDVRVGGIGSTGN